MTPDPADIQNGTLQMRSRIGLNQYEIDRSGCQSHHHLTVTSGLRECNIHAMFQSGINMRIHLVYVIVPVQICTG